MSDDLMHMLTGARERAVTLAKAKQSEIIEVRDRLHAELAELEQDVADLDGHIAAQQNKDARRKAADPPTQALPAVPPAQTVPDRSVAVPQVVPFWAALVGEWVTVTDIDGMSLTGLLTTADIVHGVTVEVDESSAIAGTHNAPLGAVASVVPAPPAAPADPAVTLTDPQDATPKDGADHDHR